MPGLVDGDAELAELGRHLTEPVTDGVEAGGGIADPLAERVDFAVVSAAPIKPTLALADERGWSDLRWLSATGTTFKRDIGGEDADGNQSPFISVYEQTPEGVRLSYSASAHIHGDHWRGVDLLSPVWHLLDLTRAGRGDWIPSH